MNKNSFVKNNSKLQACKASNTCSSQTSVCIICHFPEQNTWPLKAISVGLPTSTIKTNRSFFVRSESLNVYYRCAKMMLEEKKYFKVFLQHLSNQD